MHFRSTANTRKTSIKLTPKHTPPKQTPPKHTPPKHTPPKQQPLKQTRRKTPAIKHGVSNTSTTAAGGVITDNGMFLICESSSVSLLNPTKPMFGSAVECDDGLVYSLDLEIPSSATPTSHLSTGFTATDYSLDRPSNSSGSVQSVFHSAESRVAAPVEDLENIPLSSRKEKRSNAREETKRHQNISTQSSYNPAIKTLKSSRLVDYSSSDTPMFDKNLHNIFVRSGVFGELPILPKTLQLKFSSGRETGTPFPLEIGSPDRPDHQFDSFLGTYSGSVSETIKQFLEEIDPVSNSPYISSHKHEGNSRTDSKDLPKQEEFPPLLDHIQLSPSDQDLDKIININVGGENYYVKYGVLRQYPDTLLGSDQLFDYYLMDLQCFFFDRNRFLFEYILQYYQTGLLNIPADFCHTMTNKDISRQSSYNFRKIDDLLRLELDFFKIEYVEESNEEEEEDVIEDSVEAQKEEVKKMLEGLDPELSGWISRKLNLYLFLTNPQSSNCSTAWMILDYFLVVFSVVLLFLESEERFEDYISNENTIYAKIIATVKVITQVFFTIDFCLRLIAWPSPNTMRGVKTFLTNGSNICDLISLMPFYLPQIIFLLDNRDVKSLVVLRIIRTLRIIKIFRMVRHSTRMQFIFEFLLRNNVTDILILAELFLVMVLVFSSVIYYVEHMAGNLDIISIPSAVWWSVVTLSGIGYGDIVPISGLGKLVAALSIMCGMIFLALPLSIILHEFVKYMKSKGILMWTDMEHGGKKEQFQKIFINPKRT